MEYSGRGIGSDDMQARNQILILQYLQRHGVSTRAQISKVIGLTQAAVSKITSHLIAEGIIEETGSCAGEKGRRSIGLRIAQDGKKVIGAKLSRRNYNVGVFDFGSECLANTAEQFQAEDKLEDVFHRIRSAIRKYLKQYPDISAIGIAVPGPFLKHEERILMITEMGDKSAANINIRQEFASARFGDIPVVTGQDANAGVMADWWFNIENRRFSGVIVHMLIGEGVGAGVMANGKLYEGAQGTAAEIGHMSIDYNGERCHCGSYGCLETYCSSIAFVKHAMAQRQSEPSSALNRYSRLTAQIIFNEANAGDELAVRLVKRVGEYIGYGVVNVVNLYNPSAIIISNDMAGGGQLLLDTVKAVAKERLLPELYERVDIVLSTFQQDDILYGAAALAIDYCLNRPASLSSKQA